MHLLRAVADLEHATFIILLIFVSQHRDQTALAIGFRPDPKARYSRATKLAFFVFSDDDDD